MAKSDFPSAKAKHKKKSGGLLGRRLEAGW